MIDTFSDKNRHFVRLLRLQLLLLLFADDVALVARTLEGLEGLYSAFRAFCDTNHLKVNRDKTKVVITHGSHTDSDLLVCGEYF